MSILELALAIALGILIVMIVPLIPLVFIGIPIHIVTWYEGRIEDRKKEKELISKGAKNIKVKNGIIYQTE